MSVGTTGNSINEDSIDSYNGQGPSLLPDTITCFSIWLIFGKSSFGSHVSWTFPVVWQDENL